MYARLETVTPKMAAELLRHNDSNRNLSRSLVSKYASDMKSGAWETNGETICISKDGTLKDGQHRLSAVIQANVPVQMLVVYDVEDAVHEYDRGAKRSAKNILEVNNYPKSICSPSSVGALNLLADMAGYRGITDSQLMKIADNIGKEISLSLTATNSGSNNPLSRKSGCIAAASTFMYFLTDIETPKSFFYAVNTGFVEGPSKYSAVVLRNFLLEIQKYSSRTIVRETYLQTLASLIDYRNGCPRRKKYSVKKQIPIDEAMRETIKGWLK